MGGLRYRMEGLGMESLVQQKVVHTWQMPDSGKTHRLKGESRASKLRLVAEVVVKGKMR